MLPSIDQAIDKFYYYYEKGFLNIPLLFKSFLDESLGGGVFYVLYLLCVPILFYVSYWIYYSRTPLRAFLSQAFRKLVYSKSFRFDLYWSLFSVLKINSAIIKVFSIIVLTDIFLSADFLSEIVERYGLAQNSSPAASDILRWLGLILVSDFSIYLSHRLSHTVPILWAFHKVHHYPNHINYFANSRQHPFEAVIWGVISTSILFLYSLFFFPTFTTTEGLNFDNIGLFWLALALPRLFNRFIHLGVPISFGPLNYLLISPSVHMFHHSDTVFNKNFGSFFAIWDVIFKTFYHPSSRDAVADGANKIGIGISDDYYPNFLSVLVEPFRESFLIIKNKMVRRSGKT